VKKLKFFTKEKQKVPRKNPGNPRKTQEKPQIEK
jgi:hypothetical protein